ncbi:MAG: M48 family metalloprotease [Verrucomicrobiota bacterium]
MTREEFDRLVREVEDGIGRDPARLGKHTARVAVLGYFGLLFPLLLLLLFAGLLLAPLFFWNLESALLPAIAGGLLLLIGGGSLLRVLWVRLEPPPGRVVTRADAPALHALLEELRRKLRAAPFHVVMLTPGCNASVVQMPRLGVLGWHRYYLLLGLDLIESLSVDELRAVVAHEFTHLSRHGRLGHWIYRLRRSWEKEFEAMERPINPEEVSLRPLVNKYIQWFWPRFNASAFVLSRAQEYEADAVAARLAEPTHLASALLRIAFSQRFLEESFWADFWQEANRSPLIPAGAFLRARDALRDSWRHEDAVKWVAQAFKTPTTNVDTHPCLTDRLRALGRLPAELAPARLAPLLRPAAMSAAEALLDMSLLSAAREELEKKWRQECEPLWASRHAKAKALEDRLSRLDQSARAAADTDVLWDKARALLELQEDKAAEPLLRQIVEQRPDHPHANFHLGRLLIEADNPAGVPHLEKVMEPDEEWFPHAAQLLRAHYLRTGQVECVREVERKLDRFEQALAASQAERSSIQASDPLASHDLSAAELDSLLRVLREERDLAAAHLARKELRFFPKQRLFLLCVRSRAPWFWSGDRDQALVRRLTQSVRLPGRFLVFAPSGSYRALARRLLKISRSKVFP